jgi:YaiO family outer membrane protein
LGYARVDLYTGALDSAKARVYLVLAQRPTDRDAQALAARISLARGDARGAEQTFRSLADGDRRDHDSFLGLGDALRAQSREDEARAAYEIAQAIDPSSVDIRERLAVRPPPRWRLDLDGNVSRLTQGLEPWREGRIGLGYLVDDRTSLSGAVEIFQRFGKTDVSADGRLDYRLDDNRTAYLRVGGTPEAQFRPDVLIETGLTHKLRSHVGAFGAAVALMDLGYGRYPFGRDIGTGRIGLQQELIRTRLWITGQMIGTATGDGDQIGGFALRADARISNVVRVFLGYANAPDTSDGRVFKTRAVSAGVSVDVTDNITARVSASREDRKSGYDRTSLAVGITTRF